VQYQSVAVDQLAQFIGVVVVVASSRMFRSPTTYIDSWKTATQSRTAAKELLRYGDRSWTVDDYHGGGELTDKGSET